MRKTEARNRLLPKNGRTGCNMFAKCALFDIHKKKGKKSTKIETYVWQQQLPHARRRRKIKKKQRTVRKTELISKSTKPIFKVIVYYTVINEQKSRKGELFPLLIYLFLCMYSIPLKCTYISTRYAERHCCVCVWPHKNGYLNVTDIVFGILHNVRIKYVVLCAVSGIEYRRLQTRRFLPLHPVSIPLCLFLSFSVEKALSIIKHERAIECSSHS